MTEVYDEAFWDERYRSSETIWSGRPNRYLVSETEDLVPGTALDIGAGEGGDAIWLAQQGWRVTGVDISQVALARAAAFADRAGAEIAARIEWVHGDVIDYVPEPGRYDLVSAQYMHLPQPARAGLWERLGAAVAPGGTLLVVAHHPTDLEVVPRAGPKDLMYTGEELVALFSGPGWEVVTDAAPARTHEHEGQQVTLHDTVVRVRRRA